MHMDRILIMLSALIVLLVGAGAVVAFVKSQDRGGTYVSCAIVAEVQDGPGGYNVTADLLEDHPALWEALSAASPGDPGVVHLPSCHDQAALRTDLDARGVEPIPKTLTYVLSHANTTFHVDLAPDVA